MTRFHFPVPPRLSVDRVVAALLALGLVGALLGALVGVVVGTTYAAKREVLVRVWSIDSLVLSGQASDVTPSDLADAATVLGSDVVIDEARSTLGEDTVERDDLANSISAVPAQTSNFVEVTVTGPSANEADRRAQAVVAAFVLVVQDKVLASARQIIDGTTDGANAVPADIAARAQAVVSLEPVQVYTTSGTERSGLSIPTLVAAGAVAFIGLGALLVVLLAFGPARLRRPDDVLATLDLPGARWRRDDATTDTGTGTGTGTDVLEYGRRDSGVPAGLLAAARDGVVAVCPARPEDETAAHDFATWLVADVPGASPLGPGDTPAHGLVILDAPAVSLPMSRLPAASVASLVVVTAVGVPTEAVVRARESLEHWRSVDAVILVG